MATPAARPHHQHPLSRLEVGLRDQHAPGGRRHRGTAAASRIAIPAGPRRAPAGCGWELEPPGPPRHPPWRPAHPGPDAKRAAQALLARPAVVAAAAARPRGSASPARPLDAGDTPPSAATSPAASTPVMCGHGSPTAGPRPRTIRSRWFSAHACTRTNASPGPGGGSGDLLIAEDFRTAGLVERDRLHRPTPS